MVEWSFSYISQCPNVHISIEPNSWLVNQQIRWLISGMSIYKTRWIDGSVYSTVNRRSFRFRQLPKHRGKCCQLFLTFKPINKMAKKIENIPLPKENFLAGYKPIVPHFADDEPSSTEIDKAPKLTRDEKAYSDLFLKAPDSSKRTRVVYVSNEHLDCLKEMARFLKDEYGTEVTISGVVWNLLEHHFNTYGKTIGSLIDKNRPQMPDRFK